MKVLSLAIALIFGLATFHSAEAQTQQGADTWPMDRAAWVQLFDHQMAQLLESPSEDVQEEAILHIIEHAKYEDASGDPVFDFEKAAPKLLHLFETDEKQGRRLLALAGLHAIGDDMIMARLQRSLTEEESEFVQRRIKHIVSANRE